MSVRPKKPGESDESYYRYLAKQADQRLVRLEKYANESGYENVLKYAYNRAIYDIRHLTGDLDSSRFSRVPVRNKDGSISKRNLQARINAVTKFLESPTSTKRGVQQVYKKRAETLNERYGVGLSWQQLASYFEKGSNDKLDRIAGGSKTTLRVVGALYHFGSDPEQIQKAIDGEVKISNDEAVNEIAVSLLEQGLTIEDLI